MVENITYRRGCDQAMSIENQGPVIVLMERPPKTVTAEISAFIKGTPGDVTPEFIQLAAATEANADSAAQSLAGIQVIQTQLPTVAQFDSMQAQVNALQLDPANGVTAWTIQAKSFDVVQGAPSYGAVTGRLGAWQFAQSVAGYVATPLALPSHWQTMDVYVQWVNMVANTGNVVMSGEINQWGVGDSINVTPAGGSGIFAANATPWVLRESKVAANLGAPLNAGKNTTLRIARQGASANDTLLNSIAILAIRLVKIT